LVDIKTVQNNFEKSLREVRNEVKLNDSENDSQSDLSMKNISIFIAVPLVCLATVLNIGLIILCLREKISLRIEGGNDQM
jgi:hypothetical protein